MKFNFLKKLKNKIVENVTDGTVPQEAKTSNVIEKIHNEFDSAADRALNEALFILSQKGIEETKKEKAQLMQKLGFTHTAQVRELEKRIEIDNAAKKKANIVNKYKEKYPQYKFIFLDQIKQICEKYGLICGMAGMYKGDIPLKNLKEMETFKVSDDDRYYIYSSSSSWYVDPNAALSENAHVESYIEVEQEKRVNREFSIYNNRHRVKIPFFICAPKSEMHMEGYKLNGVFAYKEIPDPIVLHYVKDGFLIVTKWGIEGDDPIVNK